MHPVEDKLTRMRQFGLGHQRSCPAITRRRKTRPRSRSSRPANGTHLPHRNGWPEDQGHAQRPADQRLRQHLLQSGFLALQVHSSPSKVQFRNLQVRYGVWFLVCLLFAEMQRKKRAQAVP